MDLAPFGFGHRNPFHLQVDIALIGLVYNVSNFRAGKCTIDGRTHLMVRGNEAETEL